MEDKAGRPQPGRKLLTASGQVNDEEQPAGDIALWIFGSTPLDRQIKIDIQQTEGRWVTVQ